MSNFGSSMAYSDLNEFVSPQSNKLVSANSNVVTAEAFAVKIAPKIHLCHGYIKNNIDLPESSNIFSVGSLRACSSLILTSPVTHASYPLLYGNYAMYTANSALPSGYYYVTGCIIEL